jgi:hypothetical protein
LYPKDKRELVEGERNVSGSKKIRKGEATQPKRSKDEK